VDVHGNSAIKITRQRRSNGPKRGGEKILRRDFSASVLLKLSKKS
jgi:hypothetical protein